MGANAKFLVFAVPVIVLVFSMSVDFVLSQGNGFCSPQCDEPVATDTDGDDPYTAGWCTLDTEECEETGFDVWECVDYDYDFFDYCSNQVLREYFEDVNGEESCGSITYDCSIRHCHG
ncbi:MAG: hypothetical protein JSV39_02945 [Candidatus Aenigmatarchaeota archaeon]|nr:MAG: hypothetical protein JSV39_02945 [Candidatus Aenigmarchaeota archaeon]